MDSASTALPELGGLCTYEEAGRVGYSVDANVARLVRYHWIQRRVAQVLVARLPGTPEWEVKGAMALHQWLDHEHVDALRRRIAEMRSPPPRLDVAPDAELERTLVLAEAAPATLELLAGIYGVLRPALVAAYEEHLAVTNPLVDHPTRRVLRIALEEQREMIAWGRRALDALEHASDEGSERRGTAEAVVRRALSRARGVGGDEPGAPPGGPERPPPERPRHDLTPRRDARFRGSFNFLFPPHVVYAAGHVSAEERNLALLCKRLLEMDVPEMMASFMTERDDRPWEYYRDYARQLWDEARHSMMGEVALELRGADWRRVPLNVGFSLRLGRHAEPLERQVVLWAIEQGLMPGDTGKRYEHLTAVAAGDALSAHFHDYDWADEVLHVHIGRRWLRDEGITPDEATELARRVHERTWRALDAYREGHAQEEWWSAFVERVLGVPTTARPEDLTEDPTVVAE